MNSLRRCCALIALVMVGAISAEPTGSPATSASPSPDESPTPTIAESVTDLSAQRAAMERSRIYHAGADYSKWLDQIAKDSGNAFSQRKVFENVTWMRLLASLGAIALLSIFAGGFVWIVRRRAG